MAEDMRQKAAGDFERLYKNGIDALEQALDAKRTYSVKCGNARCGRTNQITGFPDVKAIVAGLQFLHDIGLGKPGQQKEQPQAAVVKPGADLEELSDAELAAIASS